MTKRVYVWTHNWLSPLQKGIQGAHAIAELGHSCMRNSAPSEAYAAYQEWVTQNKTLIYFNGGSSESLLELRRSLEGSLSGENQTWWADFCEDQESLEGVMTAIAVLPTTNVCDAADYCRGMGLKDYRMGDRMMTGTFNLTGWEVDLVNTIISSRMAS